MGLKDIKEGEVIPIFTAHTFQYGYWKHYSMADYKIEKATAFEIIGRDVQYPQTMIRVTEAELKSGFMRLTHG